MVGHGLVDQAQGAARNSLPPSLASMPTDLASAGESVLGGVRNELPGSIPDAIPSASTIPGLVPSALTPDLPTSVPANLPTGVPALATTALTKTGLEDSSLGSPDINSGITSAMANAPGGPVTFEQLMAKMQAMSGPAPAAAATESAPAAAAQATEAPPMSATQSIPAAAAPSATTAAAGTAAAGAAGAIGGASAAAAGASAQNLDELAAKLYDPLVARIKAELWLDRERSGTLTNTHR